MATPMRAQRGLAAVEMAVIMPVFLLLLMGTAELGRACYHYNTLTKAVRDGARHVSANARNGAGVVVLSATAVDAARNLVVAGHPAGGAPLLPGLAPGDVTISESPAGYITVTVAYDYQPLLATIPTFGAGDGDLAVVGTLTASVVMAAM